MADTFKDTPPSEWVLDQFNKYLDIAGDGMKVKVADYPSTAGNPFVSLVLSYDHHTDGLADTNLSPEQAEALGYMLLYAAQKAKGEVE